MVELRVSVSNVGGIDQLECTFEDTVNVITGPNASNKTSLLRAIAFGLGRPSIPIKNDAEEARVELELDGERAVRTARTTPTGREISGEGLLESSDDVELLERFACLFEFNEVRQAVRSGGDFEAVLKGPMDLDALERERTEKLTLKRELQNDVEQLDGVDEELSTSREALREATDRVEELEAELDALRERQTAVSTESEDLSALHEERAEVVRRRNGYEEQVSDLEESVERLDERVAELDGSIREKRAEADQYDVEELRAERDQLEGDLEEIEDRFEVLQSVLNANREMLHSSHTGALGQEASLIEDTVTCWACGDDAVVSEIEETFEHLQEIVERDRERRREREPRIRELEAEIEEAERVERRVAELEAEKRDLEERRESRKDSLATKREQLSAVRDELAELDEELRTFEDEQQSEVSDLTDEIDRVQDDLHGARSDVARLQSVVENLEDDRRERQRKRDRVEELSEEITGITERIEHLEDHLREAFNDAMDDLLSLLAYEDVNRMWLDGDFDLVVSREVDGVTRRDSVEHLSESEREMVGLVLALAGYVAYDVNEAVPVLMIDTLGAFDAERTADLLAYFADEVQFLIASLLPGSADAVGRLDVEHGVVQPADRVASG